MAACDDCGAETDLVCPDCPGEIAVCEDCGGVAPRESCGVRASTRHCHACQRTDVPLEACPYWRDVENRDPDTFRECCETCSHECAMDI